MTFNGYTEAAPNDDLAEKYQLTSPWVVAEAMCVLERINKYWVRRT